ncbi:MAG: hypothetical protein FWH54_00120 [Methanobrevibacter sp.]|nr:hypothetical protein [Methanobrevibacter sp.]
MSEDKKSFQETLNEKVYPFLKTRKGKTVAILGACCVGVLILIGIGSMLPDTGSIYLDQDTTIYIGNNTTCTISGHVTNINSLEMKSKDLNISKKMESKEDKFNETIEIPLEMETATIEIHFNDTNGKEKYVTVLLERVENSENYLTTDILNAKNCKLDKYTFTEPNNTIDSEFYIKLSKHNFKEIGFGKDGKGSWESAIKIYNANPTFEVYGFTSEKKNIGGFEGYLQIWENGGFVFTFQKNGVTYSISDIDMDMEWNEHVEKDIGILLKEWDSKS